MSFDLAALADRFKRAGAPPPATDPAPSPATPPAPVERPWLTAEAFTNIYPAESAPRAAADLPASGSTTPPEAARRVAPPAGGSSRPPTGRRPKRRRWALPTSPADRAAEQVDPPPPELHPCPHCGQRHQPVPLRDGGMFAAYRKTIVGWGDDRPPPVSSGHVDTSSLVRDSFHPWRARSTGEAPTPGLTLRERIAHLWNGP